MEIAPSSPQQIPEPQSFDMDFDMDQGAGMVRRVVPTNAVTTEVTEQDFQPFEEIDNAERQRRSSEVSPMASQEHP
jgi:hypothetical protein